MDKLKEHDEKFDKIDEKFDKIDKRFEKVDSTLANHEAQLDTIVMTVLKHDKDIDWIKENMATKDDIRGIHDTLDKIVGLVEKRDQEQVFMGERVKRVEKDIEKIKPLVGLV